MTEKYCYNDFVVEKDQFDCNGNVKKRKLLMDIMGCDADTPGARLIVLLSKVTIGVTLAPLASCWHGLQC